MESKIKKVSNEIAEATENIRIGQIDTARDKIAEGMKNIEITNELEK